MESGTPRGDTRDIKELQVEISEIRPEEWRNYKEFFLQILKDDSTAFSSSFEEESKLEDSRWEDYVKHLALSENNIFLLARDGKK